MKKSFKLALGASMLFLLSSCAAYHVTAPVAVMDNSIETHVAADIDYTSAKKVEATVETKTLFGFIALVKNGNKTMTNSNFRYGYSKPEKQALYRVKKQSGADMILDPTFESEKHSYFFGAYKTTKTKVTGWGVKVNGIKPDR